MARRNYKIPQQRSVTFTLPGTAGGWLSLNIFTSHLNPFVPLKFQYLLRRSKCAVLKVIKIYEKTKQNAE